MNIKKDLNIDLHIGFWLGVAVISLINIALIIINHDQFAFDWYMIGVSIVILIVFTIIRGRLKRRRRFR